MLKADHEAIESAAKGDAKKAAFQKMHADMQQVMTQVEPILTKDQLQKWNDFKAKREDRWKKHQS